MNVSLRQLRGFLNVARLGSFTRAAEPLHITQAGLSAMMRDLETQFDCRLFDRTTRSVSLTREGAALLGFAAEAVRQLEAAEIAVKSSVESARRILTIAVTPVFAAVLAPTVCRAFAAIEPAVDVRIRDVPRGEIQGLVEAGEVDLGLGIFLKHTAGTELQALTRFPLVYVSPAGSDGGSRERRGLASLPWPRLPDHPLIALAPETPVQQVVEDRLLAAGLSRPSRQVCNSMQSVLALIGAGFGAAILPAMVVPSCPVERFAVRRLVRPVTRLPFYGMTKKGRRAPATVGPFVRTLVAEVDRLCASQPAR